jgi:hypothetical protein
MGVIPSTHDLTVNSDSYHLHGRFVFLITTQIAVFYGFHLRNILLDRFTFPWSKVASSARRWPFRSSDLLDGLVIVLLYSSICHLTSAMIFAFGRGLLSLLNLIPFLSPILAPLTRQLLEGPWTIFLPFLHISLLFKSFLLSVMTLSSLEFAGMLFDAFVSQVSTRTKQKTRHFLHHYTARGRGKEHIESPPHGRLRRCFLGHVHEVSRILRALSNCN